MKTYKLLAALTILLLLFSTSAVMAQGKDATMGKGMQKKSSPFLIVGKLPHLTKLLMQQWDNPELKLTEEQKEKLLVIRNRTIGGARKLGGKIAMLETEVVTGISSGKTPEDLSGTVQSIAELKSQATMLHLRCIYDTNAILTPAQKSLL